MASNFNSFDQSPAGAFIQSPLGARGLPGVPPLGTRTLSWGADSVFPNVHAGGGDTENNWTGNLFDYNRIIRVYPTAHPSWWNQFLAGWSGEMHIIVRALKERAESSAFQGCQPEIDIDNRATYDVSVGYVNSLASGLHWNPDLLHGPVDYAEGPLIPPPYDGNAPPELWIPNPCVGTVHFTYPNRLRYPQSPGHPEIGIPGGGEFSEITGGLPLLAVTHWGGFVQSFPADDEPVAAINQAGGVTWRMTNGVWP